MTLEAGGLSASSVKDEGYGHHHEQESEDDAVVLLSGAVEPGDNHGGLTIGHPGRAVKGEGSAACLYGDSLCIEAMPRPVHCIVAVAPDGAIGAAGRLAWDIPEDARYFRDLTEGGVMIEGPVCYAELGGVLPGRGTVVVSRDVNRVYPGAERASDMTAALALAQAMPWPGPVWITGGQRVYAEGLPHCERLYITRVGLNIVGDRFFPADWEQAFPRILSQRVSRHGKIPLSFEVRARL